MGADVECAAADANTFDVCPFFEEEMDELETAETRAGYVDHDDQNGASP